MRGLRVVVVILAAATGVASAAPSSGRIVDAHGKAIRGATISIEGSDRVVTTDANGRFAIDAECGASFVIMKDGFGAGLGTACQSDDVVLLAEEAVAET